MLALEQIQAAIVDVCVFSAIRPHAFTEPVFLCFDNLMQDFFQNKTAIVDEKSLTKQVLDRDIMSHQPYD